MVADEKMFTDEKTIRKRREVPHKIQADCNIGAPSHWEFYPAQPAPDTFR
jgi:hypothetical protein